MKDNNLTSGNSFSTYRTKATKRNQRRLWLSLASLVVVSSLVLGWKVVGVLL